MEVSVEIEKPRRGRPRLTSDKKKESYIRFLLTNDEREMLDKSSAAHGVTMSELLRSMIKTRYAVDKRNGKFRSRVDDI